MSPTGYGDSPYQSLSAFAGNPMLISPEKLVQAGYLHESDLVEIPPFPNERVAFGEVIPFKTDLLNRAFSRFQEQPSGEDFEAFRHFCNEQAFWLDDFALYMAIKEHNALRPWDTWEREVIERNPETLAALHIDFSDEIENQKFRQWQFFEQWWALKEYVNSKGIQVIGDIPIFVSMDSADVWANSRMFEFDEQLQPTVVSGVPPDVFSETGQFWGHPLYRWDLMEEEGYEWWIQRFRVALAQVDIIRIDHFRGFYDYWAVPADEETAINGSWIKGPGSDLLRAVADSLGAVPIIAEDLGAFTQESRAGVDALLIEFGYPGMKVLQFAFGSDADDAFLPHNFTREWVVYTGTHDNDTIVGWFQSSSSESERQRALSYMDVDGSDIAWDMIRLAWASVADTAITPAQDLLNLDGSARMNLPSTMGAPNWCWRVIPGALSDEVADRLREMTALYGRLPQNLDFNQ